MAFRAAEAEMEFANIVWNTKNLQHSVWHMRNWTKIVFFLFTNVECLFGRRDGLCWREKKKRGGGGERDARQRESGGGRLKAPFLSPPPLSALECKATPPPPPFTGIKAEEIRLENSFSPLLFYGESCVGVDYIVSDWRESLLHWALKVTMTLCFYHLLNKPVGRMQFSDML